LLKALYINHDAVLLEYSVGEEIFLVVPAGGGAGGGDTSNAEFSSI
jgi:hypothetical protein